MQQQKRMKFHRVVMMAAEAERHKRQQAEFEAEAARVEAERARAQAKADAIAKTRADELDQKERELERRERDRMRALESRAAAVAHEHRMKDCWFRVRRGVMAMAQARKLKFHRAVRMAVDQERHRRAQETRDAEAARMGAEHAESQAKIEAATLALAKRGEELARREHELAERERQKVLATEVRVGALRKEQRVRDLWFRVRRGVSLMAQTRRAKVCSHDSDAAVVRLGHTNVRAVARSCSCDVHY